MTEEKLCKKCGLIKDADDFHKSKRNNDGLQGYCKECMKQSQKRYYERNKPLIKERRRQRLSHPVKGPRLRKQLKEANRRWRKG